MLLNFQCHSRPCAKAGEACKITALFSSYDEGEEGGNGVTPAGPFPPLCGGVIPLAGALRTPSSITPPTPRLCSPAVGRRAFQAVLGLLVDRWIEHILEDQRVDWLSALLACSIQDPFQTQDSFA